MTAAGRGAPEGRRPPRWRVAVALLAAVALVVWGGSQRIATGPAAGTAFETQPGRIAAVDAPRPPGQFRLGTFNIHGGKGTDEVRDLGRIADTLRGLDFVGLNEVHGPYHPGGDDQAAVLGRELGLPWLFAPTERRWAYYDFGNGAISRLPVRSWLRIPLPRGEAKSLRNLLWLEVTVDDRPVRVMVTHLDRSHDATRREQLRTVAAAFLALAEPAVLLGDLNTDDSDPALQTLLAAPGVVDVLDTRPEQDRPGRIDWILVRGLKVLDAGLVANGASDHPHVWAALELPPAAVAPR